MSKQNQPLSVVISTRKIDDKYLEHVSKMFSHPKTQILIYENEGEYSLPQLYNKGLEDSSNDIVVFIMMILYWRPITLPLRLLKYSNQIPIMV